MDSDKKECGAHSILLATVMRVQAQQDKISEEISENNVRMGVVELQVSTLNDSFKIFQISQNANYDRLFEMLERQELARRKIRWRPVHTVALVTSIFGPAAVVAAAWINAKFNTGGAP